MKTDSEAFVPLSAEINSPAAAIPRDRADYKLTSIVTSTASSCQEQVIACTKTLTEAAKDSLGCLEKVTAQWGNFNRTKEWKELTDATTSGRKAVTKLNQQVTTYSQALVDIERLQSQWLEAVNTRSGELQTLDAQYQLTQDKLEFQENSLFRLREEAAVAEQSLETTKADLVATNTQLKQAREDISQFKYWIPKSPKSRARPRDEYKELVISTGQNQEEQSKLTKSLYERREKLTQDESNLQTRYNDQQQRETELAFRIRVHNDRESELRKLEEKATTDTFKNHRDRNFLCEAMDSLQSVVGLLKPVEDTEKDIQQESRYLASAVQVRISTLEEKLQNEREAITEHMQNVNHWKSANMHASREVNTLKNDIISKEDAIQAHLRTIAERDIQIAEHLLNVDGLGRENQKLQIEADDLDHVLKERSGDGDRLTSRVQELEQSLKASRRQYNTTFQQQHDVQAKCDGLQGENEELKVSAERDSNSRQQALITLQALQKSTANEATTNQHRITELEAEVQQLASRITQQNAQSTARVRRQDQQATETPLVVIPRRIIAEGSYIPYEMEDSDIISQESGIHQKRTRNDHTMVPGSEDVASKRVRFADDTEPAIHIQTAPSRNQPSRSHADGFINIDDLRDPSFLHANVPTAVVDRIRVQMENWDRIRPDWEEGTKRGDLKCAHKFANHQGSSLNGPYACDECTVKHRVCLAVRASKVQIRPLANRGPAVTEEDSRIWKVQFFFVVTRAVLSTCLSLPNTTYELNSPPFNYRTHLRYASQRNTNGS